MRKSKIEFSTSTPPGGEVAISRPKKKYAHFFQRIFRF